MRAREPFPKIGPQVADEHGRLHLGDRAGVSRSAVDGSDDRPLASDNRYHEKEGDPDVSDDTLPVRATHRRSGEKNPETRKPESPRPTWHRPPHRSETLPPVAAG